MLQCIHSAIVVVFKSPLDHFKRKWNRESANNMMGMIKMCLNIQNLIINHARKFEYIITRVRMVLEINRGSVAIPLDKDFELDVPRFNLKSHEPFIILITKLKGIRSQTLYFKHLKPTDFLVQLFEIIYMSYITSNF